MGLIGALIAWSRKRCLESPISMLIMLNAMPAGAMLILLNAMQKGLPGIQRGLLVMVRNYPECKA